MAEPLTIRLPGNLDAISVQASAEAPGESIARAEEQIALSQTRLDAERAEVSQAHTALQDALAQFNQLRADMLQEAEDQLVDLAVEIARKIMAQEIQAEKHQIDPIVKEALSNVPACKEVVVRLHAEDLSRCELAEQSDGDSPGQSLRFVADPNVPRAGCVLETSQGIVESAPEPQLARVAQALKGPQ